MDNELDILPECLNNLNKRQAFTCPEHYFEENISRTVKDIDQIVFKEFGFTKKNPFHTPINYFNSNIDKTISLVHLNNKNSSDSFDLPANYFIGLSEKVIQKIRQEEIKAPIRKIYFTRTRIVSIAAMFLVMLSLFLYRIENRSQSKDFNLSDIDDDTLIEYIASNEFDLNSVSDLLDEQNIPEISISNDDLDDNSVNELLETY
ncbi:MAG: hypothetical protein ABI851_05975 [Saprospiraceae bacterium]